MGQIASEIGPAVGGVRPDDRRADEGRPVEGVDVLGAVVEEHAHVERAIDSAVLHPRGALGCSGEDLSVGLAEFASNESKAIIVLELQQPSLHRRNITHEFPLMLR